MITTATYEPSASRLWLWAKPPKPRPKPIAVVADMPLDLQLLVYISRWPRRAPMEVA